MHEFFKRDARLTNLTIEKLKSLRYDELERMESIADGLMLAHRQCNRILINKSIEELMKCVNRFLNDISSCSRIFYNENIDGIFFGMSVVPIIDNRLFEIFEYRSSPFKKPKTIAFKHFFMEIDGKLMDADLNLSAREFVAILLHEIGHILFNDISSVMFVDALNTYMIDSGDYLFEDVLKLTFWIFMFGYMAYIPYLARIAQEKRADSFVYMSNRGADLESALTRIVTMRSTLRPEKGKVNGFVRATWAFKLAFNLTDRIGTLKTLEKLKQSSKSKIETEILNNMIFSIKRKDIKKELQLREQATLLEVSSFGIHALQELENELYEFEIRLKDMRDPEDALALMYRVNKNIRIIDRWIMITERGGKGRPEEKEVLEKLYALKERYDYVREKILSQKTYVRRYGVYVNYNNIEELEAVNQRR